jgi:phenylalanyl-tRNA synthetase alpha chain
MEQAIENIRREVLAAIDASADADALEQVRIQYLGRNGSIPALLEGMKSVPKEDRPKIGKIANELKTVVAEAFQTKKDSFGAGTTGEQIDETLPGRPLDVGSLHPVYQVRDEAIAIFRRIGFALADGPDIEWEYYNFDALNTPADHPARNEQDTFYLKTGGAEGCANPASQFGRLLLRTQTSPVQIRTMQQQKPPVRIIAPGRCYRRDEIDATHGMSFHQMEGLVVAEGVSLADLKGTMEFFFRELLGDDL